MVPQRLFAISIFVDIVSDYDLVDACHMRWLFRVENIGLGQTVRVWEIFVRQCLDVGNPKRNFSVAV